MLYLFALLLLGLCATSARADTSALAGAWRVEEITYAWDGGEQKIAAPQPGLLLFTADGHYSMTWHHTPVRQPDYATAWKPTDEEKVAAYNAIVVNAGRYALAGNTLTTFVEVAKTVEFEGGMALWLWELEGDELKLESGDILNYKDEMDPGVGRFVTKLRCSRK